MKRILVTRPRSQANGFAEKLHSAGFEAIFFPVIEIQPMQENPALDRALEKLNCYEWIVFTSVNGVEVVFDRLSPRRLGKGLGTKSAAIGPKTAEALQTRGVTPDFVPDEYVAESILPGLGDLLGKWVLLPRAEIARKALPEAILNAGGIAHEIAVYKTLPAQPDVKGLTALKDGVDWITFTSPSTVRNFVEIVRKQKMDPLQLTGNPKVACIGPITENAAREEGFEVDLVAEKYTTEGLVSALQTV
jgi:uroporphyrinogen-III synthase